MQYIILYHRDLSLLIGKMVVERLLEESGGRRILGRGRLIQDGFLGITWKGWGGVFKVAPCSDGE